VVHILSRPGETWEGERGHLDQAAIQRLAGDRLKSSLFFLCCPPPLTKSLLGLLQGLGVPKERISLEYFSL
jgi:ferredoxin-NADP reductase